MIKAIETQYQGYRFRSRLEARWAVFFDALGIKWEYEKEGYDLGELGWYLPDFWLPDKQVWVEVKPQMPSEEESEKIRALVAGTECYGGICLTNIPESIRDWGTEQEAYSKDLESGWYDFLSDVTIDDSEAYLGFDEPEVIWSSAFRHILCPVCGDEYVHMNEPIWTPSDDYSAWEGRGESLRIPMYCERGHEWTVLFGFHKGSTFTRVENLTKKSDCVMTWLAGGNEKGVDAALVVARSARFEHGENGTRR